MWPHAFTSLAALALILAPTPALPADDAPETGTELHVVGIYEGFTETGGQVHGPKALVEVMRPGKSVTLVLTSHTPVTWHVTLGPKTGLERVVLGGHAR